MAMIKLFLQFEGNRRIELIELDAAASVREILIAAVTVGFSKEHVKDAHVFGLDCEEPFNLEHTLETAGIRDKHRVHVHRCRKVKATIHFNDVTKHFDFAPSVTVEHVKREFVHKIHMSTVDATEHVLQLCCSSDRPEPDVQLGALVHEKCSVCFDFVPVKRVEG